MSNHDIVDEAFHQFVQQFHTEEQKVLLAFYRELVGKRRIPYKIKDRNFSVDIQMCQGFTVDVEFQDVLIEDGRHPKEILMDSLRGERLADGRYRLSFMNRLAPLGENQAPKESSFSFASIRGGVRLWDYNVHTIKLGRDSRGLPWNLVYETFQAIAQKRKVFGIGYLNAYEREAIEIFKFLGPYLELYLLPTTKIGFGKSTVLCDFDRIDAAFDGKTCRDAEEFFAGLGLHRLAVIFSKEGGNSKAFIQELLYTMSSLKGNIIYKNLRNLIESCGKGHQGLNESDADMNLFRTYVREKVNKAFLDRGWKGNYPSYMTVTAPEFLEVSSVYKKQYTYLNEKIKFLYFDFVESIVDNQYCITPLTGMILPKNSNIDYRKCKSTDCFFIDGGRRRAEVFEDLTFKEGMTRKEIREKISQLSLILDLQRGGLSGL